MILSLLLLFLIVTGGNFVVASLVLSHAPAFLQNNSWFGVGWLLFLVLQFAAPGIQIYARRGAQQSRASERLQWFAYTALGMISTMLVLAVGLELISLVVNLVTQHSFAAEVDAIWFWVMVVGTIGITFIGVIEATKGLRTKTVEILLENLPKAFDGYRMVQISDLHVSSLIGKRYTQAVAERVNRLNPDVVVMTGDFIDGSVEHLRYRIAPLASIESRDGRFFITGNHEYYYGAMSWVDEHRRLGTNVLLNEHRVIERGGAKIVLAGVTDRSGGRFIPEHRQDIGRSLQGAPDHAVKILLAHQPGCYDEAENHGVDLQLSGHTHGGQFFPWQFVVRMVHRYAHGLYKHRRMWIYVNPGTGFWGPPLRAMVPPEITVIVLRSILS